ncbi:hypothetical protein AB0I22_14710 [Streptomyces sp. NPDC050610]|uniref:hypothetical protein n=1 Tax=Streptomyces sp. NPDC050610 TaxID=3157097 RepID=UPI0034482DB1
MATWGLIVETMDGRSERARWVAGVMGSVEGTREEAMAALETHVRRHLPTRPRNARRTRLFRDGDGLLMVVDTSWRDFYSRFTVAEMIFDSDAPQPPPPEPPEPAVSKTEEPENSAPDVDRYADGIPVKPSWLGRDDLP